MVINKELKIRHHIASQNGFMVNMPCHMNLMSLLCFPVLVDKGNGRDVTS